MNKNLLIFSILCAICWGIFIYVTHRINSQPIEDTNDPAWACTALGKADLLGIDGEAIGSIAKGDSLHLLASSHDQHNMVMVQTAKGERGWVEHTILPDYYKLRSIEIDQAAHFHSKTFEQNVIGKDFETLEKEYASALQIVPKKKTKKNPDENGFSAVFPMRVLTKGSKQVTRYATVQFQDGQAVAVETDSVFEKKAARAKIDPLIFTFLDKGFFVKASQRATPHYTSKLPDGAEQDKDNSWVDRIGNILLVIVLLVLLAAFPVLLIAPLIVIIYLFVDDGFYRGLLSIILMLAALVLFFTVYSILSTTVSFLLLAVNLIAMALMLIHCNNSVY